jgi:hypothetical protein
MIACLAEDRRKRQRARVHWRQVQVTLVSEFTIDPRLRDRGRGASDRPAAQKEHERGCDWDTKHLCMLLVPLGEARLGRIGFDEWLRRSQAAA